MYIPVRFLTLPDKEHGGRRVQWEGFGTDDQDTTMEQPASRGGTIDNHSWALLEEDFIRNEEEEEEEDEEEDDARNQQELYAERAELKRRSVERRGGLECTCSHSTEGAAGSCDSNECINK